MASDTPDEQEEERQIWQFQLKYSNAKRGLETKANEYYHMWPDMGAALPKKYWGCLPQVLVLGVCPVNKIFTVASPLFYDSADLSRLLEKLSQTLSHVQQLAINRSAEAAEDGTAPLPG